MPNLPLATDLASLDRLTSVLLPVGSRLPACDAKLDFSRLDAELAHALDLLEHQLSTVRQVEDALLRLSGMTMQFAQAIAAGSAPNAERDTFADAPHALDANTLDDFDVYDSYFRVSRAILDAPAFAAGLTQTLSLMLADAPTAMLGRDEFIALLRAMRAMLARIGSISGTQANGVTAPGAPDLPDAPGLRLTLRWRVGHHLFAYCAMHARAALENAAAALSPRDDAAVAEALLQAALFVRATAAAQWYTSEFPIAFYLDALRPTMEATPGHGGFSGTQNADYRRLQWTRERTIEALCATFGPDAAAWPAAIYTALMTLNEMEIQAAEHHVLVAASKVQLDRSLAQKALGASAGHESAVAMLREKVDAAASDIVERFSSQATRRLRACAVSDIPQEHPLAVRLDGIDIVLCHAYGAIWACAGVCPHAGGELGDGHMADNEIVCPLHGAKFDPRTGAVVRGPARDPIETYTVVIAGDDAFVELP